MYLKIEVNVSFVLIILTWVQTWVDLDWTQEVTETLEDSDCQHTVSVCSGFNCSLHYSLDMLRTSVCYSVNTVLRNIMQTVFVVFFVIFCCSKYPALPYHVFALCSRWPPQSSLYSEPPFAFPVTYGRHEKFRRGIIWLSRNFTIEGTHSTDLLQYCD